jgi:HK97 family phage portal protein
VAIVQYNGSRLSLRERINALLSPRSVKEAAFPAVAYTTLTSFTASFFDTTADNYIRYGYKQNPTVFACVSALATGFSEPPLCVYDREGNKLEKHPLLDLLRRPNPIMGQDEFWQYVMVYMALTGNVYLHKVRSGGRKVVEIWPYHGGQMRPVPKGNNWVSGYEYRTGDGRTTPIPIEDIIHVKWLVDPTAPWMGIAPLEAVAKDVDTSNELARFLKALLENDAVMRGVLELPADRPITPEKRELMKREFQMKFTGDKRGQVGVLEPGVKYTRMALNLQELDLAGLAFVPEAHICQAFMVPPIVANAQVGLDKGTYSNYEQAIERFTNGTLVPKWKAAASEFDSSLLNEYGGGGGGSGYYCAFDITAVGALTESEDNLWERAISAFEKRVITLNEARAKLGYESIEGGDEMAPEPEPPVLPGQEPAADEEEDEQMPMQDDMKKGITVQVKAAQAQSRRLAQAERKVTRRLEKALSKHYDAIAEHVS